MFHHRFRSCVDLGTTDGETVFYRGQRENCRAKVHKKVFGKLFQSDVSL